MSGLLIFLAIIALILLIAALTSGLVERAPISFPMIFLALGFLLGGHGLGVIHIGLDDPALETTATISLVFVLFLDAVNLRFDVIRKDWIVPLLSLGPGTLLTTLLIALAATLLLHFPLLYALLLGSVLSSVDPVLLRDVVRDERIPRSIRESMRTEAGANDIIVLPVLLIVVAIDQGQMSSVGSLLGVLGRLFLIGPLAGAAVGAITSVLMIWVRKRILISREYRALYGIGSILAAYLAGTALGGSGFLAVFAAGIATVLLDYDLCDCFLEYGEITSEMMMLLAFILFGDLLSSMIWSVPLVAGLLFALAAVLLARPLAIGLVLRKAPVSRRARMFIGWFGPRGLSSLLFGLLLVSQRAPGAEQILAAAGVVVIVSVVLHGVSAGPLAAAYNRAVQKETLPEEREGTAAGLFFANPESIARISPQELHDLLESNDPPIVLDVRSRSTYNREAERIPGSTRVLPDEVAEWADDRPRDRLIVTYCT